MYKRQLSGLYNLGPDLVDQIQNHLRTSTELVISEEIIMQIEKDKQSNPDEEKKVKRLMLSITAVALLMVLLIAGSLFLMLKGVRNVANRPVVQVAEVVGSSTHGTASTPTGSRFDLEKLDKITLPPSLAVNPLPIPQEDHSVRTVTPVKRRKP